jgi:surface polysaccharide O-acyltransferase-like enzyme
MTASPLRTRLEAVECLRVAGSLAVIVIHAAPFNRAGQLGLAWNAATVANQLARFAVPAFFVLAGYFWAVRAVSADASAAAADEITWRLVRQLLLLWGCWSLLYVLPFDGALFARTFPAAWLDQLTRNTHWIATHPGTVLLQGTNGHLWFLPALASAVAVAAVVRRWVGWRALLALALLAALYALLARPYTVTALGLVVPYNARNGPAFALPCVVAGMALARHAPAPRWVPLGVALVAGGAIVSVAELSWLHHAHRVRLAQDFVAGTFAVGVGAAMVALANPRWMRGARLASVGASVLGIYLVHPLVVDLLQPLARQAPPVLGDLALLAAVFALSLVVTRGLERLPATRWLVRTR